MSCTASSFHRPWTDPFHGMPQDLRVCFWKHDRGQDLLSRSPSVFTVSLTRGLLKAFVYLNSLRSMEEAITGHWSLAGIPGGKEWQIYGERGVAIYSLPMLCQNMSPEPLILAPWSLTHFPPYAVSKMGHAPFIPPCKTC